MTYRPEVNMADHIVSLPSHFKYLNQFASSSYAPNPALYRCVAASAAMAAQIAYPGRWIPEQLEDQLYTQLAGPDVPTDTNGITKEAILKWFDLVKIGYYDNAKYFSDQNHLLAVMQKQNIAGVPQLITVANENLLTQAISKVNLHNWTQPVTAAAHTFIRAGYSDSEGYGLYFEPAAPGFPQPVPIEWLNSIEKAQVITCVAIMPHGMPTPSPDFDWLNNTWPEPVHVPNVKDAVSTLDAIKSAYEKEDAAYAQLKAARDTAFEKVLADLLGSV